MTARLAGTLLLVACSHAAPPPPACPSVPAAPVVAAAPMPDPAFAPLATLLGAWEGNDPDHHSKGQFTLRADVSGKVLVRRSTNETPQGHHEDLMIVYATPAGLRAHYFDNEGHVIDYSISASADAIELVSDEHPGAPRFRLRYEPKPAAANGHAMMNLDFSIAMPGQTDFQHYVGGPIERTGD
jgi:hypothetical protein